MDVVTICEALAKLGAVGTLCALLLYREIYGPRNWSEAMLKVFDRLLPPQPRPPTTP